MAKKLPNLKVVQKLGAGVESIINDPDLPADVAVTRLKPDVQAWEIAEYCLAYVLRQQRNMPFHEGNQQKKEWAAVAPKMTSETTIGVLGLGLIGGRTARTFAMLGFRVLGWSRSAKEMEGVDCRYGAEALPQMLGECDYVAAILPSTTETRDLFDAEMLAHMKEGATLINAGRGDLIVEEDLLAALDAGQVGHAVLDVFQTEPLPEDHRFWHHSRVTLTPHVSGWHAGDALRVVGENYERLVEGRPLLNVVDRTAGY